MKVPATLKCTLSTALLGITTICLAPSPSFAVTTVTATVAVSATVQATCAVTATPMAFGTYTSAAASNATSTVSVTCTNTTPYTVGLDAGLTGGSVTARQMKNGAALLNYALFSDSARTVNWGNTTGSWVPGTGSGAIQALTVYGQVAAGQYVTPGSYADTITATVTY